MNKRKWKKLSKRFACALALAMLMSVNPAWAEVKVEGDTLMITDETVTSSEHKSPSAPYGHVFDFSTFENVVIKNTNTNSGAVELWGNTFFNIPNTNLIIELSGDGSNLDGFHVAAGGTYSLNDFDAEIYTKNSDALNMSHDVGGDASMIVKGDLKAVVDNGNGIRANGSRNGVCTSTLTVEGDTDITLNAGSVGQEFSIPNNDAINALKALAPPEYSEKLSELLDKFGFLIPANIAGTATYNTAAVYAGNSASEFVKESWVGDGKTKGQGVVNLNGATTITLEDDGSYGVYAGKNGTINVNDDLNITSTGKGGYGIAARGLNLIYGEVTLKFENRFLDSLYQQIYPEIMGSSFVDLDPTENTFGSHVVLNGAENTITMGEGGKALYASGVDANGKSISIRSGENGIGYLKAKGNITAEDSGTINLALKQYLSVTGDVSASDSAVIALTGMESDATEKDFTVNGTVSAASKGSVTLASAGQNTVLAEAQAYDGAAGSVIAGAQYGAGEAVTADAADSSVMLSSGVSNYIGGGVSATESGSVTLTGAAGADGAVTDGASNAVYSTHTRTSIRTNGETGDAEDITFTNAVYAANGGSVEITAGKGGVNTVATYTPNAAQDAKERAVWASDGGSVSISGTTSITAGLHTLGSDNSAAIAIAAGTDDWADDAKKDAEGNIVFDVADENRSNVTLEYGDGTGKLSSSITGDIVSGYAGSVSVMNASASDALSFTGNALAANGGELTLSLGDGSYWAGRADDYQDAASEKWRESHTDIFAPQFSNGIQSNGSVNVDLGSGSVWSVTGQSWVSKLEGDGHIYLNGEETGGYAVHIGELTGSNTFHLNLHNGAEIANGDMIYVANSANKAQNIVIVNREEVLSSMKAGDRIRFATLGNADIPFSESSATPAAFGRSTRIKDAGMLNVDFSIDYLDYNHADNDDENHDAYHGGSEMSAKKPGAEYVDSIYGANENSQNVYITRLESTENPTEEPKLSDAGRTVLNMSRANYAAAVYMDRLNKRMGEARYFAGQDEGIWARIRHDRVGRDDAFLVQNTMFEVGYDRKIASKTGTRRVGIAADYMEGDTEYNNIAGEGEIDRFGLWLYSTWLGEKGHYMDYVLKWGRMSNEFDIYGMSTGERITGDYDNNVFSASAEYGRRIELGKGWFFEPQAQVQFARITDADYVTSQGTRVEVDGVNSLIARAGFRLGREFGGKSQGSVYVKADVLHEFLGDQDVHALDGTTDSRWYTVGYDNDGTWYDVGLGLSCRTGKNSFVFLDLEHSFGNDNDDSYQISAGVQWSF